MADRKFEFTDARGGAALGVRIVTRASETEIVGKQEDGTIKIRLKASPAGDPSANQELIELLSSKLGVDKKRIEIVAGENSRDKIISVEGLTSEDLDQKLLS